MLDFYTPQKFWVLIFWSFTYSHFSAVFLKSICIMVSIWVLSSDLRSGCLSIIFLEQVWVGSSCKVMSSERSINTGIHVTNITDHFQEHLVSYTVKSRLLSSINHSSLIDLSFCIPDQSHILMIKAEQFLSADGQIAALSSPNLLSWVNSMGLIYDNSLAIVLVCMLLRKSPLTMGGGSRHSAKFILRMKSKPGENWKFSCTEILPLLNFLALKFLPPYLHCPLS